MSFQALYNLFVVINKTVFERVKNEGENKRRIKRGNSKGS